MAKRRYDLIDRVQYLGLRLVSMMLHVFPVDLNLWTARRIGDIIYAIDRKHRQRALANLRNSFPEMTEAQREQIARQSMQHLIMLGVEVLFTTRLIRLETWTDYIELENFHRVVLSFVRKERGLIMLTGHYGNWEVIGYTMATLGFETVSVARPLDNPYINQWLLGVRQKQGQRILDKVGAASAVAETLSEGGTVGFIADQNAGPKGIFVDFFGRKASTYKSIGLMAMRYEAPIVIGYARRLGNRFKFRICIEDVIWPADWKEQPDPLRYITQRYTAAIEAFVRQEPGQYLWVHRRWKTRPKGEAPEKYD